MANHFSPLASDLAASTSSSEVMLSSVSASTPVVFSDSEEEEELSVVDGVESSDIDVDDDSLVLVGLIEVDADTVNVEASALEDRSPLDDFFSLTRSFFSDFSAFSLKSLDSFSLLSFAFSFSFSSASFFSFSFASRYNETIHLATR